LRFRYTRHVLYPKGNIGDAENASYKNAGKENSGKKILLSSMNHESVSLITDGDYIPVEYRVYVYSV